MHISERITLTALPNGVGAVLGGDPILKLTLFVSPGLTFDAAGGGPKEVRLEDEFPDLWNWPDKVNALVSHGLKVRFRGKMPIVVDLDAQRVSAEADLKLWQILFLDAIVRSFRFKRYGGMPIHSFAAAEVWSMVEQLYGEAARDQQRALPLVDGLKQNRWLASLAAVAGQNVGEPSPEEVAQIRQAIHDLLSSDKAIPHSPTGFDPADYPLAWLIQLTDFYRSKEYVGLTSPTLPRIDFHEAVSALGEYPLLLRRLGLAVDVRVPWDPRLVAGLGPWTVEWLSTAPVQWDPQVKDPLRLPRTSCIVSQKEFRAAEGGGSVLARGRLRLGDASSFALLQGDVDSRALKLLNSAYNLWQAQPEQELGVEARAGLPALRSGGLWVGRVDRAVATHQAMVRAAGLHARVDKPEQIILAAEDLVRGYRVDVWDDQSKVWHSLCLRQGTYEFTKSELLPIRLRTRDLTTDLLLEEGIVSTALRKEKNDKTQAEELYQHESLFQWDGWSLCVPRPGRTMAPRPQGDKTDLMTAEEVRAQAAGKANLGLWARFEAQAGTLPRLRFGRSYRLRARAVDLAGNSERFRPKSDGLDPATDTPEQFYARYEPIAAPAVILCNWIGEPSPDGSSVTFPGEAVQRLVIRSQNTEPALDKVQTEATCQRRAVPPSTGELMAELHGMFDDKPPTGWDDWYKLIASKEGTFDEVVPVTPAEDAPAPTILSLPYLPDPMAGAALFLGLPGTLFEADETLPDLGEGAKWIELNVELPEPMKLGIVRIDFLPGGAEWPLAQPVRLMLMEGDNVPKWDGKTRVLQVCLPKGHTAIAQVASAPQDAGLLRAEVMAAYRWAIEGLGPDKTAKQRETALAGGHWMLTPPRWLRLVHATKQPVGQPTVMASTEDKASVGQTHIVLDHVAVDKIHGWSTGKIDLVAGWTDPYDDIAQPKVEERERKAHLAEAAIIRNPELGTSYVPPDTMTVEQMAEQHRPGGELIGHWFGGVRHEFGDTRHRWVNYRIWSTTRYREYFNPVVTGAEPPEPWMRVSEPWKDVDVQNSTRPPAPKVLYVVPTFGWQETTEPLTVKRTRRGGGLRVYLERPWYVTGPDELLGVLYHTQMPIGEDDPVRPYVTLYGHDPIWYPAGALNSMLSFPLEELDPKVNPDRYRDQGLAELTADASQPAAPVQNLRVAGHKVEYDEERRLWYADLEIDAGKSYFPFVRLALVCYQPHSIRGLELSPVVIAEFAQLVPERWMTVTRDPVNPQALSVALGGRLDGGMETGHYLEVYEPRAGLSVPGQQIIPDVQDPLGWVLCDEAEVQWATAGAEELARWRVELPVVPDTEHPFRIVVKETEWIPEGTERLVYADAMLVV